MTDKTTLFHSRKLGCEICHARTAVVASIDKKTQSAIYICQECLVRDIDKNWTEKEKLELAKKLQKNGYF